MRYVLTFFALFISTVACAGYVTTDEDSCWEPDYDCVAADPEWDGKKFKVVLTNNCAERIYLKYCLELNNGGSTCGATALDVGEETNGAYSYSGTGRYKTMYIGVVQSGKDWVCSGKVPGWKELSF